MIPTLSLFGLILGIVFRQPDWVMLSLFGFAIAIITGKQPDIKSHRSDSDYWHNNRP